jgi:hypothetical protein
MARSKDFDSSVRLPPGLEVGAIRRAIEYIERELSDSVDVCFGRPMSSARWSASSARVRWTPSATARSTATLIPPSSASRICTGGGRLPSFPERVPGEQSDQAALGHPVALRPPGMVHRLALPHRSHRIAGKGQTAGDLAGGRRLPGEGRLEIREEFRRDRRQREDAYLRGQETEGETGRLRRLPAAGRDPPGRQAHPP